MAENTFHADVIDLSQPVVVPYVYQEYPRGLHGPNGKNLIVHNDEEKAEALAVGWSLTPVPADAQPPADEPKPSEPPEVPVAPVAKKQKAKK